MSEFVPLRIRTKYLLTELAIGNAKKILKRVILFKNILNIYHYIYVYIYIFKIKLLSQ